MGVATVRIWMAGLVASLALTGIRLPYSLTPAEWLFALGFPLWVYWIWSFRQKATFFRLTNFDLLLLFYVLLVGFAGIGAICPEARYEWISAAYLLGWYAVGRGVAMADPDGVAPALLWGFRTAGMINVGSSLVGMIMAYVWQDDTLTAWFYEDYPYFGDMVRAHGFMSTPTMMALLSGTGLLYELSLAKQGMNRRRWLWIALDMAGLLMTSSKIIVAVAAGVLMICFFRKRISRITAWWQIGLLTVILIVSTHYLFYRADAPVLPAVTGQWLFHTGYGDVYASSYLELKWGSWQAIRDFFPRGTGPGCHGAYIQTLIDRGLFPQAIGTGNPHGTYTGIAAELGLGGILFMLSLAVLLIHSFMKGFSMRHASAYTDVKRSTHLSTRRCVLSVFRRNKLRGTHLKSPFAIGRAHSAQEFSCHRLHHLFIFMASYTVFFGVAGCCSDLLTQRQLWLLWGVWMGMLPFVLQSYRAYPGNPSASSHVIE